MSWQMPGMPDPLRLLQAQVDVLSGLPETLNDLQASVRGLAEAVEASKEAALAAQRVVARIELVLSEVEDPARGLAPGLERLAEVLNDPVVERIPDALTTIEDSVLPIAAALSRTRARLARARAAREAAAARLRTMSRRSRS